MENKPYQLELFKTGQNLLQSGQSRRHGSALTGFRSYEKTVLLIIALVTTGIVSFAVGVERGKRLALLTNNSRLDVTMQPQPSASGEKASATKNEITSPRGELPTKQIAPARERIPEQKKNNQELNGYTIQLASYRTKTAAKREAEALEKKGLSPFLMSKGNYIIICVGNFADKNAAKNRQSEFERRYKDCIVRRL
ncbi:MAG: SPOR domain-containing protein [Candidatus Omnitrophica bacterium]|nr:SPOR domain-containing protein [Candidatus Omnitrophota bacterium]